MTVGKTGNSLRNTSTTYLHPFLLDMAPNISFVYIYDVLLYTKRARSSSNTDIVWVAPCSKFLDLHILNFIARSSHSGHKTRYKRTHRRVQLLCEISPMKRRLINYKWQMITMPVNLYYLAACKETQTPRKHQIKRVTIHTKTHNQLTMKKIN